MDVSRSDWIRAATAALRHGGITAVRIEKLARDLGVTKGSFYWHFRDRGDLYDALLVFWEEETEWLIGEAERLATPIDRLIGFFNLVSRTRIYPPDIAIFEWARHDPAVARRAARVEHRRIAFIARQVQDSGVERREAQRRAEIVYLTTLGWMERSGRITDKPDLVGFTTSLFQLLLETRVRDLGRRLAASGEQ